LEVVMHRGPTAAEIEYLTLKFGEIRADELARTLSCARCPWATECPVSYCPDSDARHLALRGCPATAPTPTGAFAYAA
jgi:hypothetical protein